jgi:hypothetical protein
LAEVEVKSSDSPDETRPFEGKGSSPLTSSSEVAMYLLEAATNPALLASAIGAGGVPALASTSGGVPCQSLRDSFTRGETVD